MDKGKGRWLPYLIILILAVLICGILFYMIPYRFSLSSSYSFSVDPTLTDNPLMGFAPRAEDREQAALAELVFIELSWSEWEPAEGQFDVAGMEDKYHIAEWKEAGKHAVLRFVMDIPGQDKHTDLPDWLFRKLAGGSYYQLKDGRCGYSPDYSDPALIDYHVKAIKALQDYCSKDHFVSFVEIGSIGHHGTWSFEEETKDLMPAQAVCDRYQAVYQEGFLHAVLMKPADVTYLESEDMPEYLDLSIEDMEDSSSAEFGSLLQSVTDHHITFLGPEIPDLREDKLKLARESLQKRMGYRIYISALETQYDFSKNELSLYLDWKNDGSAAFYFDWPVTVEIYNSEGKKIYWQNLDLDLRKLEKEQAVRSMISIPYSEEIGQEFSVGVTIRDYDKKETLKLADDPEALPDLFWEKDSQIIYHYQRK